MSIEDMKNSAFCGGLYSVATFLGASLGALSSKAKVIPLIKSATSVAIMGGISTSLFVYAYKSFNEEEDEKTYLKNGIALIIACAATIFTSPILSKHISNYHISYLQSAGLTMSALPFCISFAFIYALNEFEKVVNVFAEELARREMERSLFRGIFPYSLYV